MIHPHFATLPQEFQQESLKLIKQVNERHLHCNDTAMWERVHLAITEKLSYYFEKKRNKARNGVQPMQVQGAPLPPKDRLRATAFEISSKGHVLLFNRVKKALQDIYHDPLFVDPMMEALQRHILLPFSKNGELAEAICHWIIWNAMYLPLGVHLLKAFQEDMAEKSDFAQRVLKLAKFEFYPEALSLEVLSRMQAFLSDVMQAHCHSYGEPPQEGPPTAVVLSVKNGAGGHTAPHRAMEARLKELGMRVVTICYDTDLQADSDPFQLLGITFADGEPMTRNLYITRWRMQKQCKDIARIVSYYIDRRIELAPDLFRDESGGDLLRRQVLPLNPKLIVTTLAYHWVWKSLAYRIPTAKTILVASDVFFHSEAIKAWSRQRSLPENLRQIHFTAMTDDLELLMDEGNQHDRYHRAKYPHLQIDEWAPLFNGLQLDEQITVIGAPINPAFNAVTSAEEIKRLKEKWQVPDNAISISISRGKLGYTSDLIPALEGYRTLEKLPKPVILHVVCGENREFYNRLCRGKFNNLGPNITIRPHPLLAPPDFAEIRSISMVDDIKGGGGSAFEGWYLISKGAKTLLLLTPGAELWWEGTNCLAMEKWGIGRTATLETGKIEVLKELMQKGLPEITHYFPDWKKPFDRLVRRLK